jgi:pantetheine-phosphate adenylyltransferase
VKRAVYAGSFDPITLGHLWMVRAGADLFDELVVAIGVNPEKKYAFPLEERLDMLRESIGERPDVRVDTFGSLYLVDYARSVGAGYVLRGIRTEADYGFERGMRHVNADLNPDVVTVFLMPPREISEVSSSLVKGLIGPEGWEEVVARLVPPAVHRALLRRFGNGPADEA